MHPRVSLPLLDPGVQPGSRTLPLEAGKCPRRLHVRQPPGQPSQPHGQRQHGQEVGLSRKDNACLIVHCSCSWFSLSSSAFLRPALTPSTLWTWRRVSHVRNRWMWRLPASFAKPPGKGFLGANRWSQLVEGPGRPLGIPLSPLLQNRLGV